jgi:hypothetical protein
VYGKEKAKDLLDEAVRAVIIILIFVFDPVAVLLVIAGTMTLQQASFSDEGPTKSTKSFSVQKKEKTKPLPTTKKEIKEVIKEVPVEKIVEIIKEADVDPAEIEKIIDTALGNMSGNTRIVNGSVQSFDLDARTKKLFKKELRKVLAERKTE